jgi:hypothetical protein
MLLYTRQASCAVHEFSGSQSRPPAKKHSSRSRSRSKGSTTSKRSISAALRFNRYPPRLPHVASAIPAFPSVHRILEK